MIPFCRKSEQGFRVQQGNKNDCGTRKPLEKTQNTVFLDNVEEGLRENSRKYLVASRAYYGVGISSIAKRGLKT